MEYIIIILLCLVIAVLIWVVVSFRSRISGMYNEIQATSENRFKALAADSLRENAEYVENIGSRKIDSLLGPLKMRLEDFNLAMERSRTDAAASRRSLSDHISRLESLNSRLGEDTRRLADALKGNNRFQGKWGETVLEKILETAGLVKGINFIPQASRDLSGNTIVSEEGRIQRPDMLVLLPDDRNIIIDAKTSLSAYIAYNNTSNDEEQKEAAIRHLNSIKRHVDTLAAKEYQKNINGAMGHVLMFIPNDAALILAISEDPALPEYAMRKNIAIVSPLHLMSVIQLVSEIWKKEYQDRNASEIAKAGGLVYDAAIAFISEMGNIERGLKTANAAFESALSKLDGSPRSLSARAGRLRDLGIKTNKTPSR